MPVYAYFTELHISGKEYPQHICPSLCNLKISVLDALPITYVCSSVWTLDLPLNYEHDQVLN